MQNNQARLEESIKNLNIYRIELRYIQDEKERLAEKANTLLEKINIEKKIVDDMVKEMQELQSPKVKENLSTVH